MAEDTKEPQNRKPGVFEKGDPRINPGGRPRIPAEVKEAWAAMTPKGTRMLDEALGATRPVVVSGGKDSPATVEYVPDWTARLTALELLYSRQWGKAPQAITGEDGGPVKVDFAAITEKFRKMAGESE